MTLRQRCWYLYLAYLSRPAHARLLYRIVRKQRCRQILELGIGTAQRAARLVQLAQIGVPADQVRYTGIDRFEDRGPDAPKGLSLKMAYRQCREWGLPARLIPGDPLSALSRAARLLHDVDLVILSADEPLESLDPACWFYLARLLSPRATVLVEGPASAQSRGGYRLLSLDEIAARAQAAAPRRVAA